jgi:hypothetical protein
MGRLRHALANGARVRAGRYRERSRIHRRRARYRPWEPPKALLDDQARQFLPHALGNPKAIGRGEPVEH